MKRQNTDAAQEALQRVEAERAELEAARLNSEREREAQRRLIESEARAREVEIMKREALAAEREAEAARREAEATRREEAALVALAEADVSRRGSEAGEAGDSATSLGGFDSDMGVAHEPASPERDADDGGDGLLPDWDRAYDDESQDFYYFNVVTGETRWDKPTAKDELEDELNSEGDSDGWDLDDDDELYAKLDAPAPEQGVVSHATYAPAIETDGSFPTPPQVPPSRAVPDALDEPLTAPPARAPPLPPTAAPPLPSTENRPPLPASASGKAPRGPPSAPVSIDLFELLRFKRIMEAPKKKKGLTFNLPCSKS